MPKHPDTVLAGFYFDRVYGIGVLMDRAKAPTKKLTFLDAPNSE